MSEQSKGRIYVMGDIHGGARGLAQVLERCEFDNELDTLIQLGDVADGWSETYECVEILLGIKNLISLRGNHDYTFLMWLRTGHHPFRWSQGAFATLTSYTKALNLKIESRRSESLDVHNNVQEQYEIKGVEPWQLPDSHLEFFSNQKSYYVDEDFNVYVHAGFDRKESLITQTDDILLWDRKLWQQALSSTSSQNRLKFEEDWIKEIFIGHTTTTSWGLDVPMKADKIWNMDTGAGFDGRLTMMEVNTKEIYQSDSLMSLYPNEMGRYKKGYPKKKL